MGRFKLANEKAAIRITAGPLAGREFILNGQQAVMGRSAEADIAVTDGALSRLHARLFLDQGQWLLEDLESKNGTWLNGERLVVPVTLQPGQTVRIGSTQFQLVLPNMEEGGFDETMITARASPLTQASLDQFANSSESAVLRRGHQQFATIYKLQALLTTGFSDDELCTQILALVTEVLPADQACLLRCEADGETLVPIAERNADGALTEARGEWISRSVVAYVRDQGEGVLSVDAQHDERFHGQSLSESSVRGVLCVPMLAQGQLFGLIYIVSQRNQRVYSSEDLRFLTAIAYSAGMAIANQHLLRKNLQAERQATIGNTAASLSHYVKNILNGFEGSVSLLRMGIDNGDHDLMNEAWNVLAANHQQLSGLLLDLLSLTRDEPLQLESCNLSELVIEATEAVQSFAQEDQISLQLDDDLRQTPVYAVVDNRAVHRAVVNLLKHALETVRQRFGASGEGVVEVSVHADREQTVALIEVADNSEGMAPEEAARLFSDPGSVRSDKGTGLGLQVAKRLLDQHGATYTVVSELLVGTMITIRLPLRLAADGQGTDLFNAASEPYLEPLSPAEVAAGEAAPAAAAPAEEAP